MGKGQMEYLKRRASIWIFAVALFSAGCHQGANQSTPDPQAETRVRVENRNFLDMNVYVLGMGQRIRLGLVPGLSTQVFTIPSYLVRSAPLQFELHPIGGRTNPRTETISVQPGDEVSLMIPPS
jgi:hypothetical protein